MYIYTSDVTVLVEFSLMVVLIRPEYIPVPMEEYHQGVDIFGHCMWIYVHNSYDRRKKKNEKSRTCRKTG